MTRVEVGARTVLVEMTDGGPILVEGPVEVALPDGRRVRSDRPVVALCACGRSRRYPFCDTTHRRFRSVTEDQPGPSGRAESNDDRPEDQACVT